MPAPKAAVNAVDWCARVHKWTAEEEHGSAKEAAAYGLQGETADADSPLADGRLRRSIEPLRFVSHHGAPAGICCRHKVRCFGSFPLDMDRRMVLCRRTDGSTPVSKHDYRTDHSQAANHILFASCAGNTDTLP